MLDHGARHSRPTNGSAKKSDCDRGENKHRDRQRDAPAPAT